MVHPQRLLNDTVQDAGLGMAINTSVIRLIPRLDIKGPNLVKGIHLEGLRVLGKPERFARYYYEQGADELIYVDVVASLYGRNSLLQIIERTSKEIFIPLTVGGGIRTIEDIRTVLKAGADKVALNTAAIQHPELIREASKRFGSSTIVVSIEAKKQPDGSYEAYTDNGRIRTGVDVLEWAKRSEALGAGEILLTSIDHEGTGNGFDIELIKKVAPSVSIPVIACGGAGKVQDIYDVINEGKADAVSAAAVLHYNYIREHYTDDDYSTEGNIEFLRSGSVFSKVQHATMFEIKDYLIRHDIPCRLMEERKAHGQ
jgi:imidazole glycerol-phosphate synthase subunit HisF